METRIHLQEALESLELIAGKALMSEKICLIYVKFRLPTQTPTRCAVQPIPMPAPSRRLASRLGEGVVACIARCSEFVRRCWRIQRSRPRSGRPRLPSQPRRRHRHSTHSRMISENRLPSAICHETPSRQWLSDKTIATQLLVSFHT